MARLDPSTYLNHIVTESHRFRAALADCDSATLVPSCPEWTADDLLWHLTEVQGFWGQIIEHRPSSPDGYEEPTRPPDHAALLAAFDRASASLVDALMRADAEDPAWSWDDDQTVGFTFRRQAQEALVHRVDAEQTAQITSALDVELAADGVDEVLAIFYGGCPPWATYTPSAYVVEVRLTDTGESILTKPGEFSGTSPSSGTVYNREQMVDVIPGPAAADAIISGTAAAVLLWLWKRADETLVTKTGDPAALEAFCTGVSAPLD